ncbi:MAG: methyltransferase domain-containing protein [Eubacteriales bacterium]|nr:methyltransferase domain-containing protein [Eubacteriales bacterium]
MAYETFADYYDLLTDNVGYKARADYIEKHFENIGHDMGLTLDLACGTGSLTLELKKRGVDIYGIDASAEMLSQAMQKAYEADESILYLCQKMQSIDLYGTIDTCLCTLDSINHLTDIADVKKTFERVSLFMNPNGVFLFDVNTPYKHEKVLSDNVFVFDTEEVYCVWQNTPREDNITDITLDFFIPEGENYYRMSEEFSERAYPLEVLRKLLEDAGFEVVSVFGDMTFEAPKEDEQRLIITARKL